MKAKTLIFYVTINLIFIFYASSLVAKAIAFETFFLDVGKGDAIYIKLPNEKNILIDSGNPITGFRVLEFLINHRVRNLDHLFITHPHPDHAGGIFSMVGNLSVKKIWGNGQKISKKYQKNDFYAQYIKQIRQRANFSIAYKNMSWIFPLNLNTPGKNKIIMKAISLTILWPGKTHKFPNWNSNSLVMLLKYKNFHCLFMGDATKDTEAALFTAGLLAKVQVLKAGHHGASDTASKKFIQATGPQNVIISVDANNENGYPSPKVIQSYKNYGARVYRMDKMGTIKMTVFKDGSYKIQASN